MATSTIEMKSAAWWQVVLSGFAVVLVAVTARYAYRAAVAAERINTITEDSAESQLRAYVFLDSAIVSEMRELGTPTINFELKNFGVTPAANFRLVVRVGFLPFPLPEALPVPDENIEAPIAIIPPGAVFRGSTSYDHQITAEACTNSATAASHSILTGSSDTRT